MSVNDLEDAFVNVTFDDQPCSAADQLNGHGATHGHSTFEQWVDHTSTKRHDDEVFLFHALQKRYPGHHIVPMQDYNDSILHFPGAVIMTDDEEQQIIRSGFVSLPKVSGIPGLVVSVPAFAVYNVFWKAWEFKLVVVRYPYGMGTQLQQFVIHKGTKATVNELIIAAGAFSEELHSEIWVYDNSIWEKDANLWTEVQKADWKDVILKPDFKEALRNDVNGFYSQQQVYKDLGIPWKRGMIFWGPAGNGKTISMKAVMKSAPATPLYVRNFRHYAGPEMAMKIVFAKARALSPSLLVLEDLDALITPETKSYFLNEVDGLDNNDGILIIGTTNYLDRIDPALSKRPSRFDRKFLFDNPDEEERTSYAKYWQRKLESNKDVTFPEELVHRIAEVTHGFSFAFLKEVFVNTLVQIATGKEKKPFAQAVLRTIETLRKEMGPGDKDDEDSVLASSQQAISPSFARSLHSHFQRFMEP